MPKIRQGPSTMLMALPNHSTRMAMAASPAPRNTALMRNSISTVPLPPSITRAKPLPVCRTSSLAPIRRSSAGAYSAPMTPTMTETTRPSAIDWIAARAAASRSFSPIRRATVAAAPIDRPMALA
jgi:hypothetical protein